MQGCNWVFVWNNPDEALTVDIVAEWDNIKCAVWQLEMGEEGTPHYQGYAEFSRNMRLAALKQLNNAMHWQKRRGTRLQAYEYNSKEDSRLEGPFTFGIWGNLNIGQGRRTDLEAACEIVKNGGTNQDLIDQCATTYVKYCRGLEALRLALPVPVAGPVPNKDCVMYWGPTRTGKSYRMRQECPEGPDWFYCSPGKWLDGYAGQSGLCFDEIRDSWFPWEDLLRLIDVYPKRRETKGGTTRCIATRFRMTANIHPKLWYSGVKGNPNRPWADSPLRARFSRIILMDQPVALPAVMAVRDDHEPAYDDPIPYQGLIQPHHMH